MNKSIYLILALLGVAKFVKCDEVERRTSQEQIDELIETDSGSTVSLEATTDILNKSELLERSDNNNNASRTERSTVNDDGTEAIDKSTKKELDKTSQSASKDSELAESKSGDVVDLDNQENKDGSEMESKSNENRDNDRSDNDPGSKEYVAKITHNPDSESKLDDSSNNTQRSDELIDDPDKSDSHLNSRTSNNHSSDENIDIAVESLGRTSSKNDAKLDKSDSNLLNIGQTRRMLSPVLEETANALKTLASVTQYVKAGAQPDYVSRTMSNINDFDSRRSYAAELDTSNAYRTLLRSDPFSHALQNYRNPGTLVTPIVTKIAKKNMYSAHDANSRKLFEKPLRRATDLSKDDSLFESSFGSNELYNNAYPFAPSEAKSGRVPKPQFPFNAPNTNIFKPYTKHQIPHYPEIYKPYNPSYLNVGYGQYGVTRFR
ncbi:uncharacterized protein LOC131841580 [Achroia grisella]|uniref:uncharacterized protein LOC131841580 n=1 Tax=Achroia grisella TaxID=688607 RepID=UPI0027D31B7F|nr:uncharacterized protein LOC131841580 [Achroia grisella]